MISFNDEEKEIINLLLDWYDKQTDFLHPPKWIFSYLSKGFTEECLAISYNKDKVIFKINVTQDNQSTLLKTLTSRVLQVHTVIETLANFQFIKLKPYHTICLNLRIQRSDGSTHHKNIKNDIMEELTYIYSIIIPNGVLTQLKKNGFKSDAQFQHEEQIKILTEQVESEKRISTTQIKYLRWQFFLAYIAVIVSIIGPAVYSLKPTAITIHDQTLPLPMAINSDKVKTLNQELISLEAKIEALKSEADKIQAQLAKPKPKPKMK